MTRPRALSTPPESCMSRPFARPRGEMDITQASGAWGRGSIPLGGSPLKRLIHRRSVRYSRDLVTSTLAGARLA